jgi:RNA polymerase sigma factor for flagellar operon FliA
MAANAVNPALRGPVVQNYFNLVQAIANKIKQHLPSHVDVEDLVQTGMIGLMEACSRYDSTRLVDFSRYANARITGAILDELRKFDTCSRQDRKIARQAETARQRLRAESGEEPSRAEIAKAVGLGLAEYERTLYRLEASKDPSGFSANRDAEFSEALDSIPSQDQTPFEFYSRREDFKTLRSHVGRLKPRQRQVLELYYFRELGLKQIGTLMGVGEARISQIHQQALSELRRLIAATKPSPGTRTPATVQ